MQTKRAISLHIKCKIWIPILLAQKFKLIKKQSNTNKQSKTLFFLDSTIYYFSHNSTKKSPLGLYYWGRSCINLRKHIPSSAKAKLWRRIITTDFFPHSLITRILLFFSNSIRQMWRTAYNKYCKVSILVLLSDILESWLWSNFSFSSHQGKSWEVTCLSLFFPTSLQTESRGQKIWLRRLVFQVFFFLLHFFSFLGHKTPDYTWAWL